MRSAIAGASGVEFDDLAGHLTDAVAKHPDLIGIERVADDDETVASEDPDRTIDLRRIEDLQPGQAVVRGEAFALRVELRGVPIASLPSELPEVGRCVCHVVVRPLLIFPRSLRSLW